MNNTPNNPPIPATSTVNQTRYRTITRNHQPADTDRDRTNRRTPPTRLSPSQPGAMVTVLIGPAAREAAATLTPKPDILIDAHAIMQTFGDFETPAIRLLGLRAAHAAIHQAARLKEQVSVLVIHPNASPGQISAYRASGHTVISANITTRRTA